VTLAERIRQAVSASGPLDDDELAARLHVVRQAVNQTARRMEKQGVLRRYVGPAGKIVNQLTAEVPVVPTRVVTPAAPRPSPAPASGDKRVEVVLVTCVKEKAESPRAAKDLYTSSLFRKERAYAEASGAPWFILSAEHGLVAPDEWLAPYERYLPDTPPSYREAWADWVVQRLTLLCGDLRGMVLEIHASEDYLSPLRPKFARVGATIREPLKGLRQGERLAWYGTVAEQHQTPSALPTLAELVEMLSDASRSLAPAEVLARGSDGWRAPGLYSWWVDASGAEDLSTGLGHDVKAGLVYAGLAGATKWPSGKRSGNTLWSRITGMHLGGNHEMSTLRRTFGSTLAEARGWETIDERALSAWMHEHLRVVMVRYDDADRLGHMEKAVLEQMDPPLNLQGMRATPLRRDLSALRSRHSKAG
jgi:hypothetical protein